MRHEGSVLTCVMDRLVLMLEVCIKIQTEGGGGRPANRCRAVAFFGRGTTRLRKRATGLGYEEWPVISLFCYVKPISGMATRAVRQNATEFTQHNGAIPHVLGFHREIVERAMRGHAEPFEF